MIWCWTSFTRLCLPLRGSSLMSCLFKSFTIFTVGCFPCWILRVVLYVLDNTLYQICILEILGNIFSICDWSFHSFNNVFSQRRLFQFLWSSIYYFMDHTLDKVSTQGHLDILLNYLKILLYYQNANKRISVDTNHPYMSASISLLPKFTFLYDISFQIFI